MVVPTNNTRPQVVFQSPSTREHPTATKHSYTPAQNSTDTNIRPTLNIITIQTKLLSNTVLFKTLSRPPILTFPTNQLQHRQTSTNSHDTNLCNSFST